MSAPERVVRYLAADGSLHETPEAAERHNASRLVAQVLNGPRGGLGDALSMRLAGVLLDHFDMEWKA